ncbi:uncharacterized protein LACBIDRAFT_331458 [Laccaria bicolor S238N-H82]|uniref:Predicted protein n=1 Tax=Laccaria bicolor (strain S238N-H82 / ATCC MYA-4686) TaxID=486041 RepID=B0DPJ3_LACBS|nr:uncharacterized protein LACBIDRAFT_331458 [Laccaria bicolor S238N-H82]EDR03460.1 predicted protein [Laccaria bicolor S238N-H82]|eukprot:XP_001885916.1 predicted protein [Laccaria bicolor S238N-H82]
MGDACLEIDDHDDSDGNDPAITRQFWESIPNCVTKAARLLFEKRSLAPFQYSKNTRHEKGFAVCPNFRALFFGLLISGRLTIVDQKSAFSDMRARKSFCLERHDLDQRGMHVERALGEEHFNCLVNLPYATFSRILYRRTPKRS